MLIEALFCIVIGYTFIYLFLLPWQASVGHYIPWERTVGGSTTGLYARLAKWVSGSSRTRFSLLLLAHVPDGIPLLLWGALACLCSAPFCHGSLWAVFYGHAGGKFSPREAEFLEGVWRFLLPVAMFVFARNAARTAVCGLCASDDEKEKGQEERQNCASLRYRKGVFLPCGFWQFFWPGTAPEAADREEKPFPVSVVPGRIGDDARYPERTEESGVPPDKAARMGGEREGERGKQGGGAYPAEGNNYLFDRGGLEKAGSFRIADEPRGKGQEAEEESRLSEAPEAVLLGADLDDAWLGSDQPAREVVAEFVKEGVKAETEVGKGELGKSDKPEERRGNLLDAGREPDLFQETQKHRIKNTRTEDADDFRQGGFLLFDAVWYVIFPVYLLFLLPTAIRSRLDWCFDKKARKEKPKVAAFLSFVGWFVSWLAEACAMGVAASGIGWLAAKF